MAIACCHKSRLPFDHIYGNTGALHCDGRGQKWRRGLLHKRPVGAHQRHRCVTGQLPLPAPHARLSAATNAAPAHYGHRATGGYENAVEPSATCSEASAAAGETPAAHAAAAQSSAAHGSICDRVKTDGGLDGKLIKSRGPQQCESASQSVRMDGLWMYRDTCGPRQTDN